MLHHTHRCTSWVRSPDPRRRPTASSCHAYCQRLCKSTALTSAACGVSWQCALHAERDLEGAETYVWGPQGLRVFQEADENLTEGSDVWAIKHGHVSVTPLKAGFHMVL